MSRNTGALTRSETTMNGNDPITPDRFARLLARLRHRQLVTARAGQFTDSYRYARRVQRLRRLGDYPSRQAHVA
jgi:hypothetical protein